jgi:hypothetical protein
MVTGLTFGVQVISTDWSFAEASSSTTADLDVSLVPRPRGMMHEMRRCQFAAGSSGQKASQSGGGEIGENPEG